MLERARRISILGPEEVSQAAESISEATLENIDREDKHGQYLASAMVRLGEQQAQVAEIHPNLHLEQFTEVLQHTHDLERLQELFSLEELERIAGHAESSIEETEEWIRRATTLGEIGEEITTEGARFLEEFRACLTWRQVDAA
ncbi:hypothetical protein MBT84_14670 [Streptomyces sp. MBT84]|uniref:hypothetical protein n=1 Tax=Streptomyces sp. MBT84 TaxID=1488414 RepID=UPI001C6ECFFF|nr:hypothetical protein [Streptomyces sp. MBT84]MBW8700842.1 hypothetical protein [Streptomyces sp. MBT84]